MPCVCHQPHGTGAGLTSHPDQHQPNMDLPVTPSDISVSSAVCMDVTCPLLPSLSINSTSRVVTYNVKLVLFYTVPMEYSYPQTMIHCMSHRLRIYDHAWLVL